MALKEKKIGNYTVKVDYDEDCTSPREWDDLSIIYSNHTRYSPDNHSIDEVIVDDENEPNGWKLQLDGMVALKVWMLEHSCCRFRTSELDEGNAFGDGLYARFDSGWFGVIAMPIEKAKKEWGDDWEEKAKNWMRMAIEEYDAYANGEIYCYEILDCDGDVVYSCGGYYDDDEALEEGIAEAKAYNESDKKEIEKFLKEGSLQELKEKFYEMATEAPSWVDEVFELVDEDKAKEWLRSQLRKFHELTEEDEDWVEVG